MAMQDECYPGKLLESVDANLHHLLGPQLDYFKCIQAR